MCPRCKRMRMLTKKKIDDEMRVGRESQSKDRQRLEKKTERQSER